MAVFLAVVHEGSFGRAAASLLISQPAVSERVVRLERIVGDRLFTRGNRGTILTPAGERFLPYAQRAVDLLAEAADAVRSVDEPPRLRVAVHSTFSHRAIPIVAAALSELPRSLKFRDAHSDEIVAMLLDGVVDVGFVLPATPPRSLRFVSAWRSRHLCLWARSPSGIESQRPTRNARQHLSRTQSVGTRCSRVSGRTPTQRSARMAMARVLRC